MASRALLHGAASKCAEQVIQDYDLNTLPIDVFELAERVGIEVLPKPPEKAGVSGMLMRYGDLYAISYATHIKSEAFQRFTVAHELGHYFMPGHPQAIFANGDIHESKAGFQSADRYEIEADHFAATLLMPKRLFLPLLRKAGHGVTAVEKLRRQCGTSWPATAIRYAQLNEDPVAIVVSDGQRIDYCFMSDELRELNGINWIKKNQIVPAGTPTALFNSNKANVANADQYHGDCKLADWFGGEREIDVLEDIVGMGGTYGKTLTILHGMELPDPEDEEGEQSLEESWTPRFRR